MRGYWVLTAVIFLGFVATGATSPFYALYVTSLGASLGQVAFVVGVQSAVAVVAGLIWGQITDRPGRRRVVLIGALASLATLFVVISLVPTWGWLIPLHALLGVASGAYQVTSLALMADILAGRPNHGGLVSRYRMFGSLAFSVAIVSSGWLSQNIGLRGSFRLAAGVYALAFVVSLLVVEPKHVASATARPGIGLLLRGPMLPLVIVAVTFGLPFAAVFSVWPIWVVNFLGYSRASYSQLWGLAAFVEVPSMFLAGLVIDRVGRRPTFVAGFVGFALIYLLYFLAPPLPGLVATQVLRGVAYATYTATALTMAIDLAPPNARGRASALFTSAQGLAQISGNWIGAPIAAALGFQALFALAASTVLGGAAYSYIVLGRPRPEASDQSSQLAKSV